MRIIMTISICIWVMSLVVLVMREDVEKRSSSAFENPSTEINTSRRRPRQTPAAALAPKNPTVTVQDALIRATPSILKPVLMI